MSSKDNQKAANKPQKKGRIPETFVEAAKSFEISKIDEIKRSRKIAWTIAIVSVSICSVSILAFLVALLIRPEPEPVIIQVDKSSGFTSVLKSIKDTDDKYDEVVNRYWLAKYVQYREAYDWYTIGEQFSAVKLMSDTNIFNEYSRKVQAPDAPLTMYKDKARVDVKILSITFISNVAQVRFSTEKKATDGANTDNSPVQKWIATIGFKFSAGMMTDQQRLLNPLGFKSISYRVDPEVLK